MRLLLDTHVLLWACADPGRIPGPTRVLLEDGGNDLVWSVVGTLELAIKAGAGKLKVPGTLESFLEEQRREMGLEILPLENRHALALASLPDLHRDPFDRLLVAQALVEGVALLSSDAFLRRYGVDVIW